MTDPPPVIGHRGAAASAPENTLAGFAAAARAGVRWVECDVSLLGDGTPVIFHDATLERTTDGAGALADADWAAVSGLDAGRWFGEEFAGERVPRLADALAAVRDLGLGINLELKPHDRGARGAGEEGTRLAAAVAAALAPPPPAGILVSSFDHAALGGFRDRDRETPVALLYGRVRPDWAATAETLGAAGVNADHRRLTRAVVEAVRASGRFVGAYTVNDLPRARTLWDWGVTSVFSDRPGELVEGRP